MGRHGDRNSKGSLGCGCFLMLFVLAGWGFTFLIFPKIPDYDEAMRDGERVPGTVVRIETVENVTINNKHPRKVVYRYGEDQEGTMTMALDESAKEGQTVQVRVLGQYAYPEGIRPLAQPGWLKVVLIGGALLAVLFIGFGILRLLVIGGALFAAGRGLAKRQDPNQPPPPPPPPAA
ncbi:hypothetical protein HAHE_18770 [Haloferula helveola]|uniref:DUF3592 domain-containing protein n=1 Tax=Haloferula helveola TaxID=490095 RepID=A0ABN6H5X8_9BACT|nr:hypothetical protein HAHE_18770 [Haloferula helveola]